jgi:ribonuclease Z
MEPPRITAFSTPLVATWVLDETHRLLFDAGDGTTAMLEGRIHRIHHVALTHAHRDHIAGLPQLLNLRAGVAFSSGTPLTVLHPEGSGSLMALARFLSAFDAGTSARTRWHPVTPLTRIPLPDHHFLRPFATNHIPQPDDDSRIRCLGYHLGRTVQRLKPELRGLPQVEIDALRKSSGKDAITETREEILLSVSGDTKPLPFETFAGTRFLLHECTFLDEDAETVAEAGERGHQHSTLPAVLELAQMAGVERLALYHISRRYTDDEIVRAVRAECAAREIAFPVSVVLPGRVCTDVFNQIVWSPAGFQPRNASRAAS